MSDGFAAPKSRRKRNNKFVPKVKVLSDHITKLTTFKDQLRHSTVYSTVKNALNSYLTAKASNPRKLLRIRCLALGSPTESDLAMYQVALMVLMAEHLEINTSKSQLNSESQLSTKDISNTATKKDSTPVISSGTQSHLNSVLSAYDPVFTDADNEFLSALDIQVTSTYTPTPHTLAYLPHSPPALIEPFLAQSEYALYVANLLENYNTHTVDPNFETKYPNIVKNVANQDKWAVLSVMEKMPKDEWGPAFNDLGVYWVKREDE